RGAGLGGCAAASGPDGVHHRAGQSALPPAGRPGRLSAPRRGPVQGADHPVAGAAEGDPRRSLILDTTDFVVSVTHARSRSAGAGCFEIIGVPHAGTAGTPDAWASGRPVQRGDPK